MTQKILYSSLFFILLFFGACRNDRGLEDQHLRKQNKETPTKLSSWISVGEAAVQRLGLRAEDKTKKIDILYILVFNEEGNFLEAVPAQVDNATTKDVAGDRYYKYTAQVHSSAKKRILHFIGATQDKAAWFQEYLSLTKQKEYLGKNEGELLFFLKPYKVGDALAKHFFWARQEYASLEGSTTLDDVMLLRNFARIRIINATPSSDDFVIHRYYIENTPKYATLAPFNPDTREFVLENLTEALDRSYIPVLSNGTGFQAVNYGEASDLFERDISSKENPFTVILDTNKGFYKLAFWDPETLEYLPVIRNHEYMYTITRVQVEGKSTLQEALESPAIINPSLSVEFKDYPKIADNDEILEVSKILLYYTTGGLRFSVDYRYKHSDGTDPSGEIVEIVLKQDKDRLVVMPNSYRYTTIVDDEISGTISGILSDIMPAKGDTYKANIRVRVGNLVRDVQVYLANKKPFPDSKISLDYHGNYETEDEVDLMINIPEGDFPKSLYPLDFFIDSKFLIPDVSNGNDSHLIIVNDHSGSFKYRYRLTEAGEHIIRFKRSQGRKSEDVLVSSDYYDTKVLELPGGPGTQELLHLRGKYDYQMLDGNIKPVLLGSSILAFPTTTRTNLRLEDDGHYVFDIFDNDDPRRPQWQKNAGNNPNITFIAKLKDGSKYKAQKTYNQLKADPDILLQSFDETTKSGYGYFINAGPERSQYSWVGPYIKTLTVSNDSKYQATIASAHPDNQVVKFRYRSVNWWGIVSNVLALATLQDLRLGRDVDFKDEIAFNVQFSYVNDGQNRIITSFYNSGGDIINRKRERIYDLERLVFLKLVLIKLLRLRWVKDIAINMMERPDKTFLKDPFLLSLVARMMNFIPQQHH